MTWRTALNEYVWSQGGAQPGSNLVPRYREAPYLRTRLYTAPYRPVRLVAAGRRGAHAGGDDTSRYGPTACGLAPRASQPSAPPRAPAKPGSGGQTRRWVGAVAAAIKRPRWPGSLRALNARGLDRHMGCSLACTADSRERLAPQLTKNNPLWPCRAQPPALWAVISSRARRQVLLKA